MVLPPPPCPVFTAKHRCLSLSLSLCPTSLFKAWHNLGYIYENGSGMPRDAKKAVQCWTKAAE
jgi:hypothetical protein